MVSKVSFVVVRLLNGHRNIFVKVMFPVEVSRNRQH